MKKLIILAVIALLVAVSLLTGLRPIKPGQRAVVRRFGRVVATRLHVRDGRIISEQAAFDGALLISCADKESSPAIVTVRGKVFAAERSGSEATIEDVSYPLSAEYGFFSSVGL